VVTLGKSASRPAVDEFDAHAYVQRRFGPKVMDADRALIEGVIEAMRELDLKPGTWRRAADVGIRPNLFPALLMAPFLADPVAGGRPPLDLIDLGVSNQPYLRAVLDDRPDPADGHQVWGKFEELMVNRSDLWSDALRSVRRHARILAGDIFALPPETYDALSAFFVAESVTDSRGQCQRAVAKLVAALRPGGFLMVGHMLGSGTEGADAEGADAAGPGVALSVADLQTMYGDHLDSMRIIEPSLTSGGQADDDGPVVVVGRKKRELAGAERVFTPYDIQNCLYDVDRVEYFRAAIRETVKVGDVVVDGGSGTGVLGLLAAKAGAARVYCVELNSEYVQVIEENARINGLSDQIVVIPGDAASVSLPEDVDVIISEVISGGLFYEPQLQILANLRKFMRPTGDVIPQAMTNYVELIDAQEELYGLKFIYDTRHRALEDRSLSTRAAYLEVAFRESTSFTVEATAVVRATTTGTANALRVPYRLQFSDGVSGDRPTEFLLNPQIIYLPVPIPVTAGEEYTIYLQYQSGDSPLSARITVTPGRA
jgi:predicted RNA methylase